VPLVPNVRVLAMPSLAHASSLICGAGHRDQRLVTSHPATALPALCAAAAAALSGDTGGGVLLRALSDNSGGGVLLGALRCDTGGGGVKADGAQWNTGGVFEWLPKPDASLVSLEDAIARSWAAEAAR